MVRKINTDRFYKMHGTPGGTVRDTELKIQYLYVLEAVLAPIYRHLRITLASV